MCEKIGSWRWLSEALEGTFEDSTRDRRALTGFLEAYQYLWLTNRTQHYIWIWDLRFYNNNKKKKKKKPRSERQPVCPQWVYYSEIGLWSRPISHRVDSGQSEYMRRGSRVWVLRVRSARAIDEGTKSWTSGSRALCVFAIRCRAGLIPSAAHHPKNSRSLEVGSVTRYELSAIIWARRHPDYYCYHYLPTYY